MSEPLLAAVDCGTNSVRLLVSRLVDGRLVEVDRRLHLTRLGQGVDATGGFHPEALARTLDAMADFGAELDALGVTHRRVVATSAARDAANSAEFFDGARARLGVDAEIIPGEEEARLSYAGAVGALPDLDQPVLVMDIGGGSTELVLGSDGRVRTAVSLDIGSVRLRERFLHSDPPTRGRGGRCDSPRRRTAGRLRRRLRRRRHLGGCRRDGHQPLRPRPGSAPPTTATCVHGSVVSRGELDELGLRLLAMPVAAVTELPTMVPGRADVICGGALIARRVASRLAPQLTVSEADILDGLVLGLVETAQL